MKGLKKYIIAGAIFVSVLGTLFHFVYNLSGNNTLVGFFTPVNESTWEHTKLIFFPMLIYSLYLNKRVRKQYPCISSAMISGSFIGVLAIITLFYTYSGVLGYNFAFADISVFFVSVIISFYAVYKLTNSCNAEKHGTLLNILRIVMVCLYILFTYFPPQIALFINP